MERQHSQLAAATRGRSQGLRTVLPAHHGRPIHQQALLRLGVTHTTAAQLSRTLIRCDFHFSLDISDAYHLALRAGGGGELRPIKRPIVSSRGPGQPNEVSWVDALVNGCTPSTCRGGCDKDLSGILIDGFVFRFAACQLGPPETPRRASSVPRARGAGWRCCTCPSPCARCLGRVAPARRRAAPDPNRIPPPFSSSNDGTATGPVPVSRLCMSCERDGAATATNGMAQP